MQQLNSGDDNLHLFLISTASPSLADEAVEVEDGSGWSQGENGPNAPTATLTAHSRVTSPYDCFMMSFFNNV